MLIKISLFLSLLFLSSCAYSSPLKEPLWKGIEGEAVGEGWIGMTAVAWVYKNRLAHNMPLGCCALHRKDLNQFISKQGALNEKMAKKIYAQVFSGQIKDPTHGATYYENIEKYGVPYWAKNMVITAKIGHHTFFKTRSI